MTSADEVLESLAEECRADHVGLWEVVHAVKFDMDVTDPGKVRELTLRLVRQLLQEHGMKVGQPAPDGRSFLAWDLSPDEAIDRIEQEWSALGREPDIGELAWLTSPD
jgi:hypothetical protein